MESTEKSPLRQKKYRIDWALLPIKLHYALFWGGSAAAVLYMPLLAKQIGIHASAVGVIYTAIALTSLLSQPGFGAISDYFQNSKVILMTLVTISAVTLFSLQHIPPIQNTRIPHGVSMACLENDFSVYPSTDYNSSCLRSAMARGGLCTSAEDQKVPAELCSKKTEPFDFNSTTRFYNFSTEANCSTFQLEGCGEHNFNWISCDASLHSCFFKNEHTETNEYNTYQFWIFGILSVVSISLVNTCYSLSDSMCYEILGENPGLFGMQRLWSTCSYGLALFLAGYLNDATAEDSSSVRYDMGFYVMLAMLSLDLVVLSRIKSTKIKMDKFSLKDVGRVLGTFDVAVFATGVFFIGILSAILYNYQFWFLQDIGASQTLLGLTMLAQNDVADLLFFFVSDRIIGYLGHMYCLVVSFLAFAARYLFYFVLPNPWYMLPVEILDGVTFALFYVTMTSFAKANAQPGTEATMVGLLVGLYSGLGAAVGSFLGGISFDRFSGAYTFLILAVVSIILCVVFLVIKLIRRKTSYAIKSSS